MTRQDPNDKTRPQPEDKTPTRRQGPNDKRKIKRNKRSRCLKQRLLWAGPKACTKQDTSSSRMLGQACTKLVSGQIQEIEQFKEKVY